MNTLNTAYTAIHAADSNAIAKDAAMSHQGLGWSTINWLINNGENTEALYFANSYAAYFFPCSSHPPYYGKVDTLKQILANPVYQYIIDWENKLFANHPYYDHMQIHEGGPWTDLSIIFSFIHSKLQAYNDDKPIDWPEAWYGWSGATGNGFHPNAKARDIVKQMVIGFSSNVTVYNYCLSTDWSISLGHTGLADSLGTIRPAAIAFKVTSQKLTVAANGQKIDLGDSTYGRINLLITEKKFMCYGAVRKKLFTCRLIGRKH